MHRFNLLIFLTLALSFSACVSTPKAPSHTTSKKPLWLLKENPLSDLQALGFAKPNFQGMYIQRATAVANARAVLSEKISSILTHEQSKKIQADSKSVRKNYESTISNISQLLLANSYQVDAFIDEDENLYVLLEIENSPMLKQILGKNIPKNTLVRELQTDKFDIKKLLDRRCYSQKELQTLQTKSPMHKGKPLWFYRPHIKNSYTSIGISEKVYSSTLQTQKELAITTAKAQLSKRKKVHIGSLYKLSEIIVNDEKGQVSSHQVKTSSKEIIKGTKLKDIWMNPKDCELFVWLQE